LESWPLALIVLGKARVEFKVNVLRDSTARGFESPGFDAMMVTPGSMVT
jgi:hypothetical protein